MFRQTICYISVLLMLGLGLWVSSAWQDVLPMVAAHPDRFFCMARCSTYVFSTFSAMVVHPDSFFFSLARCFTILKMTTWFKYWLLWQHWYNSTANMRPKCILSHCRVIKTMIFVFNTHMDFLTFHSYAKNVLWESSWCHKVVCFIIAFWGIAILAQ